jgi:hypothetical protein
MVAFLARCLAKDPNSRPDANALLEDPWIKAEVAALQSAKPRGSSQVLKALVDRHFAEIDFFRKEAKLGDGGVGGRSSANSSSSGTRGNTARDVDPVQLRGGVAALGDDGTGTLIGGVTSGTMITGTAIMGTRVLKGGVEPGSTLKVGGAPAGGNDPGFMRYFKKTAIKYKETPKSPDDEWQLPHSSAEMVELAQRLSQLDVQFQQDVVDLRRAYDKRRQALMQAAQGEH